MAQGSLSSVVHELAARLRKDISYGVLRPGQRLNIEAIKRDQNVSHPSVREALALLAGEGYVGLEAGKGFHVLDSSREDLEDITRLRTELECVGLRWSVQNTNADWRARIMAAQHVLQDLLTRPEPKNGAFLAAWDLRNNQFHMTLIENCGSPRLIETVAGFFDQSRRYRLKAYARLSIVQSVWFEQSLLEHEAIQQAVFDGNADQACTLLRRHVANGIDQASADVVADNFRI